MAWIQCTRARSSRTRSWKTAVPAIVLAVAAACMWTGAPAAFDTGPHFDICADVLRAEGFANDATKTVQVANFLIDFHEFMGTPSFRKVLDDDCLDAIDAVMKSGDAQHFDELSNTVPVSNQWDAMLDATETTAKKMATNHDVLGLLALLGASLHNVQDFYAHSNWVDGGTMGPPLGKGALAKYGDHPTWLSMDRADRNALEVYTRGPEDPPGSRKPAKSYYRTHGDWNAKPSQLALNKDWAGRPGFMDAYICAYFASRQWVRLFHTWVDAATWAQMQRGDMSPYSPDRDWEFARKISFYGGHWYGDGAPIGALDLFRSSTAGTSPDLLIPAVLEYMGGRCINKSPSALRRKIMDLLLGWGTAKFQKPMNPPMPSPDPTTKTFAVLEVRNINAIDTGDGPGGGELDYYARARIGGQQYWSGLIDEHDNFKFENNPPYWPWTMIKAIPAAAQDEELTSLWVKVTTGTSDGAGTDDNVYLWLSDKIRLEFPYDPDEDDFENGSTRTYAFTVPQNIRVRDITALKIEKPKNGRHGDWQLAGITVTANGRQIYANQAINTWLNDKTKLWQATDFKPTAPTSTDVPIVFQLMELDYRNDDKEDINPFPNAKGLGFVFADNGQVRGDVNGSAVFTSAGKGDSDRARIELTVRRVTGTCLK